MWFTVHPLAAYGMECILPTATDIFMVMVYEQCMVSGVEKGIESKGFGGRRAIGILRDEKVLFLCI